MWIIKHFGEKLTKQWAPPLYYKRRTTEYLLWTGLCLSKIDYIDLTSKSILQTRQMMYYGLLGTALFLEPARHPNGPGKWSRKGTKGKTDSVKSYLTVILSLLRIQHYPGLPMNAQSHSLSLPKNIFTHSFRFSDPISEKIYLEDPISTHRIW